MTLFNPVNICKPDFCITRFNILTLAESPNWFTKQVNEVIGATESIPHAKALFIHYPFNIFITSYSGWLNNKVTNTLSNYS